MAKQISEDDKPPGRITLVDVARDSGVSRATASLVVRNSPLVAEATRQRVLASMEKLGYVYNRGAARLRTQQSKSIGVLVLDISNPFFAELTLGAEDKLEANGYVSLLANTADTIKRQDRFLEIMLEHGVDGVILCPADETTPEDIERLQSQMPVVQIVRSVTALSCDYVGADNYQGTYLGVSHLIKHGHQRIAYVGGTPKSSARRERLDGYYAALDQHDLEIDESIVLSTSVSRNGGYEAILDLLQHSNPPTAAMCYNDMVAFGVMLGLQSAGRKPGENFSVIGFDNIADAATWRPALTTASGDPREIGRLAVEKLLKRIREPQTDVNSVILTSELIVRDSCGSHHSSPW